MSNRWHVFQITRENKTEVKNLTESKITDIGDLDLQKLNQERERLNLEAMQKKVLYKN